MAEKRERILNSEDVIVSKVGRELYNKFFRRSRPPLPSSNDMTAVGLWAGPECTLNWVGDQVRDQLTEAGFAARLDDLDRLAGLGLRRVRFPLLWERRAAGRAARGAGPAPAGRSRHRRTADGSGRK